MKRMEITEKRIGENTFYLKPFPAFTAANISGELAALITPMISALAPLAGGKATAADIMSVEIEDAAPAITNAFSSLSGDKVERLMKKLLIDNQNISVDNPESGRTEVLSMDLANELFCGDVQDMFLLCFEVIKINFGGFFKKLGAQFGDLSGLTEKVTPSSESTEN